MQGQRGAAIGLATQPYDSNAPLPTTLRRAHLVREFYQTSEAFSKKASDISYSYDIYPRPIKEIVSHGISPLALLISHVSGVYGHLNICTGSIPF